MKWTITVSRVGFILSSVVIVAILVPLCFSQPQHKCKNPDESCVQYNLCPNFSAIVRSKAFEKCYTHNYIFFMCCKNPTQVATPPTPAVSQSTASPPPLTSKNSTAVALEYCQKYTQFKYQDKWKDPDVPGKPGKYFKMANCTIAATLIVNGSPAKSKEYPHMAQIGFGKTFQDVEWACGGSLISEKFVLSAAHCGKTSIRGPPRWAKLGDLNISTATDEAMPAIYSIVKVHDHPEYNSRLAVNDISLFELNTTVAINPYVRPACLSTVTRHPIGTKGKITGWGLTGTVEKGSDHLLAATIATVGEWRCKNRFETDGYNSTSMICAGDLVTGKDTCLGDSGGPLQSVNQVPCMWDIFGVTSYGDGICGNKEDPSVFTRVSFFLDWIQSIVWP